MPFRPVNGQITQSFDFHYVHTGGEIHETITYIPGEVAQEKTVPVLDEHGKPATDKDGNPTTRAEQLAEWLDRCCAPGTFVDDQGQSITAVEFVERYPDHRWLMRELEAAIHRNSNPFTRQRLLRTT